jgi:hypothetical protein
MTSPIHIPSIPPKVESNEQKLLQLEEQNKKLTFQSWIDSLADEKVFRLELLQAIERISISLNTLTEKLIELTSQEQK